MYLTYVNPNITARIVLVSSAAFLLELCIGLTIIQHAPPKLRQASQILAFIFFASAFVSILRLFYLLHRPLAIDLFSDFTLAALSFAAICAITVWNFYLFFLNSARLELDLLESQKTLIGAADAGRHKVTQLGLLDETSRSLAESIDEMEVMRRAVRAIVNRFGYAEAAISLLVEDDYLEITVIDGTEDIGYRPGFRQKIGEGIIGRTAENQQVYISGDIAHDPYYFTIGQRVGRRCVSRCTLKASCWEFYM